MTYIQQGTAKTVWIGIPPNQQKLMRKQRVSYGVEKMAIGEKKIFDLSYKNLESMRNSCKYHGIKIKTRKMKLAGYLVERLT